MKRNSYLICYALLVVGTTWLGTQGASADPAELRLVEALSHYEQGPLSTRHCIARRLVTDLSPAEIELETAILEHGLHNDGPAQKATELNVNYAQFQRDMAKLEPAIKKECQLDKLPPPSWADVKCKDGQYFGGLNPNKPTAIACEKNGGVAEVYPRRLPPGPKRISATAKRVGNDVVIKFTNPGGFARWHPGRQLSFQLCDANKACSWAEWRDSPGGQLVFDISKVPDATYVRFCYIDGPGCQQSDERGFAIVPWNIPIVP